LILLIFFQSKTWHAGCNNLSAGQNKRPQPNPRGRSLRMNRQRAAQLRLSPLHLQQGLFGVLALLVTLIACQQYLRWEHSQQQEAPLRVVSAPDTDPFQRRQQWSRRKPADAYDFS
jgi:hypothetical protein